MNAEPYTDRSEPDLGRDEVLEREPEASHPAEDEIGRFLEPDEQLLWAGRPKRGFVLRAHDAYMIPFGFLWGGFAIFWVIMVLSMGAPIVMPIFGSFFVVIGLYFMFGRFVTDAWRRARTSYGLTDQRIVIVTGLVSRSATSLALQTLPDTSLEEKADRSGTIRFGRPRVGRPYRGFPMMPGLRAFEPPMFELIPNAKQVHDLILYAQRAAA